MRLKPIITRYSFGIPVSVTVAVLVWLFTYTINICIESDSLYGSSSRCESNSIMDYLVERQIWPLQFYPFTGWWDSYDDKFLWIISEPYFQLTRNAALSFVVWFGIRFYVKRIEGSSRPVTSATES
jgi:hypothetical protein